jgi:hypothetical protein
MASLLRASSFAPSISVPTRRDRRRPRARAHAPPSRASFSDDPKMFVPAGAFGGETPEKKASRLLTALFTYVATWIVIDQTETAAPKISTSNGADGVDDADSNEGTREAARVTNVHAFLLDFLEANPVKDGDAFLEKLTAADPSIARRVMDVRTAYAGGDFEWDICRGLVMQNMEKSNAEIQRVFLDGMMTATATAAEGEPEAS